MEHPGGSPPCVVILDEKDTEDEQTPDPPCFENRWKSLAEMRTESHQKMLALEERLKAEYGAVLKTKEVELKNKTKETRILRKELEKQTKEKGNLKMEVSERDLLLVDAKEEIQRLRDKVTAQQKEIEDLKANKEETYLASVNLVKKMSDEWQNLLIKMSEGRPSTSVEIGRQLPAITGGEDVAVPNRGGRTWVEGMVGGQNYSMSLPKPVARQSQASCPGSPASQVETEVVSFSKTPRLRLTRLSDVVTPSITSTAVKVINNKRKFLSDGDGQSSCFNDTQIFILDSDDEDEEDQVPVTPFTPAPKKYGLRMRKQRKSYASVYN